MPHSAVIAGHVDFVLPPAGIAAELSRLGQHPYLAPTPSQKADIPLASADQMETLLSMLREATAVDFTHYKHTTLQRRIQRRMILHKLETLKDYVRYVRNTPGEIEELYQDILIHVTGFFRDPGAFEALRKHVFPALFHEKRKEAVRIWVPGCSTGEEVYSLAMSLVEFLWSDDQKTTRTAGPVPFQIFATDISDSALERARSGVYSEAAISSLSPERRRRFFVALDGGYQINKSIREMCIFARQNVAKDPPFSNRPDQLPEPADLSRSSAAKASHSHTPLRAEGEWLSHIGQRRESGSLRRLLLERRQEAKDFPKEDRPRAPAHGNGHVRLCSATLARQPNSPGAANGFQYREGSRPAAVQPICARQHCDQ
jgi:chemotaxis methyl-accepting protein methylase